MTARTTGEAALSIIDAARKGDVLYLADDEQNAETIAAAVGALVPGLAVVFLPSSDTLPGDQAPASPANVGRRVAALRAIRRFTAADNTTLVAVMSGEAAARRYADPAEFDAAPPLLKIGETVDLDSFAEEMERVGYVVDDRVDEPGEVAVRGDVIDIFPADAGLPARIGVTDGKIVSIRHYDPVSQLSDRECDELEIGRAIEPPVKRWTSILDHLRTGTLLRSEKADARRKRYIDLAAEAAAHRDEKIDAVDDTRWTAGLKDWSSTDDQASTSPIPRFAEARAPLAALGRYLRPLLGNGHRLVLVGSERDIRFLRPRLSRKLRLDLNDAPDLATLLGRPEGSAGTIVAPVDRGGMLQPLILLAAADLLGSRAELGQTAEPAVLALTPSTGDVRAGDIIVHEDHGVARVVGLEPAPGREEGEMIALEYANGARRLVPVGEAGRLWRYGGDAEAVSLDRLDGSTWEKRRAAIEEALAHSADALLELAAQRAALEAPVMEPDAAAYERFVAQFPFNETADQVRAIIAVRDDLSSGRPMDRLVIGDVGFGKTEIALRAAAIAALAGFQVALAAPTTVLVRQHFQTFERRFAQAGIKVAGLSRLSSAAEKKAVKAGLADGSIDIVIGTAAVMGKGVEFARLGLVIIDEEQRFGAADKAKLRQRADIHLLAMSATPIPRTLHRAMIGLQQISVIATPPARRQPIRTSLVELEDARIRTALLRERSRGGQSFVVVPRIEDIVPFSERLRRIVPDLVLIEAHGKLPAADIDEAMVRFADGGWDVLLATNIIEAGLDVPRANTMIIWRADRFGLAQLHQLRGRVGRGNRRGQVMLVTEGGEIAERTLKRLRTLTTFDHLGAGFDISAADLDQRGAGDPLSDAQAGHIKLIGIDLYQYLFEGALKRARGEDAALWLPEINIAAPGSLPAGWIPDADIRLGLYVRLARLSEDAAIDAFEVELEDRFGPLPLPARDLLVQARIAVLARTAQIARVDAGPAAIALTPLVNASPPEAINLFEKDGRWLLKARTDDDERPGRVVELLEKIVEAAS